MVLLGEDEWKRGEVVVKDLDRRRQADGGRASALVEAIDRAARARADPRTQSP